jgi:hypothetical protein
MGKTIQSGGEEPGMYQPGQYTQYYNLMEAESGGGTGLKEQYRPAIGPAGTVLPPKPGTIGYTGPETTTAPVADIAGRRQRIEDSLTRAAFGPERIREILKQLEASSFLANGGRVGMAGGGVSQGLDYLTGVKRQGYADGDIASGLAIRLNRPVQPGDPIGSYYGGTPIMISNKKVEPTLNTDNQGRPG